ncbi:MAG: EAL domain-containing protein [Gammaproteobacteria bacterium]|nr:EAL domain-containing protein [Gammaproteobacteria bacterium]
MPDPADEKSYAPGSMVFRQGDPTDHAYMINSGRVEIVANGIAISVLGPGEIFGEMALIDGRPRSASARALEESVLLPISREFMSTRMQKADPLMRLLLKQVLSRLRDQQPAADGWTGEKRATPGLTQQQVAVELNMATDLRSALSHDALELHFQPIVTLPHNRLVGFEALARWDRPGVGFVPPPHFVGVAEETGLIVPLGRWVLVRACQALKRMQRRRRRVAGDDEALFMSVNMSAHQLYTDGEVQQLLDIVGSTGVSPKRLKLEITESVLMDDPSLAERAIMILRDAGVRIAIDDFGTGYSSLSYLNRFPLDTLKVDRSFVAPLPGDGAGLRIVKAILSLARELGLTTIAEGVEEIDQLTCLAKLNCDYAQGFLISRPLPETEMHEWMTPLAPRRPQQRRAVPG